MNDELKIKNNELGGKMNYRYRTDEEMKDSGVEWIGKIPKEWSVNRLKNITNIFGRIGFRGYTVEDLVNEGEGAITLSPSNIENQSLVLDKKTYISWSKYEESPEIKIYNGDIVFVKTASVGKAALIEGLNEKATINPQFVVFKNIGCNKKYLYYNTISNVIQQQVNRAVNGGVVGTLTQQDINNYSLPYPTIVEQEKIAKFLDEKTAQFDSIISKKEALIEKLEEAKKSLISEVVTGKVRVVKTDDGYELVERKKEEMKDSGVEWLGDIPKEWIRKKLKYNCYIKGRIGWQGLKQSEFIDEGPYLITGMNFKNGVINWSEVYHISEERYQEAPEIHLKLGDVLITKDGTIGKLLFIDYLPGKASLNSHLLVMRPLNNDFLPKFLYYSLDASYFKEYVEQVKTGTTFFGITQESISNFNLLIPSLDEQKIVIEYLDERLKILNEIIYKVKYEITKIKEAKKSLISEAVTGKIEILD